MNKTEDNVMNDASEALHDAADKAAPAVRELRGRVNDAISASADAIADASASAAKTLKSAAASTDDFVRDNPWIAVGVAAGIAGAIGFLAGLSAAPKRRFWN